MTSISIVVPTHNESANVSPLHERLSSVFAKLVGYDFELIFVDDSTDDTPARIKELHLHDPRVKLLRLTRKFGQAVAIAAGLKATTGDAAILMDADLQDPPESIPALLEKWREGNDLVYVERASASNSLVYAVAAKLFYRILQKIAYISIPLNAGEFRLLGRPLIDFMNNLKEHSRFMRGITVWPGYKTAKIAIARGDRLHGATNYNFRRSLGVAVDGFISFSVLPLRVATLLGISFSLLSFVIAIVYFLCWLFSASTFGSGWMSLFLGNLFLGGLNLMCLGIIGEYLGRCFTELQGRPLYIVEYSIGLEGADDATHTPATQANGNA